MSAKFFEKFEGPYKIVEVLSPTIYLLDLEGKSLRLPMVHLKQLQSYVPREPRWKAPAKTIPVKKLVQPPPEPTHDRVLHSQTRKLAEKRKGQGV